MTPAHPVSSPQARNWRRGRGFTLTELAVVLMIVALLTGGLIASLSAQQDLRQIQETRTTLATARDALLGYAAANGRLPCPATAAANTGVAAPDTGIGACTTDPGNDYFVPAVTLGIGPTDERGYLIDAWGNRIRYRLTAVSTWAYAKTGQIRAVGMAGLAPDLRICSTRSCTAGTVLASGAVAVILSTGQNSPEAPPGGSDEAENRDNDQDFVSRTPGPDGARTFDDQLLWLSPNILYGRMMAANQLP